MLDDSLRLQENPQLLALLAHYAQKGTEDRVIWQDRLMQIEGVDAKQLSALHGELIACDWIEQNTGQATVRHDGAIAACYRSTLHGLREFRRFHGGELEEERSTTPEKAEPRFRRKKKESPEQALGTTSAKTTIERLCQ